MFLAVFVFAGFQRFYLAGASAVTGGPIVDELFVYAVLHGICATAWMLALIAQPLLVASRNRKLHMALGWWLLGLAALVAARKVTPAAIRVVDVPGTGPQLLGNLRQVDAILAVLDGFSPDATPADDLETLKLELLVADRDHVERRQERVAKEAKSGDPSKRAELETLLVDWPGKDTHAPNPTTHRLRIDPLQEQVIGDAGLPADRTVSFAEAEALSDDAPIRCVDPAVEQAMIAGIDKAREAGDTLGGSFEIIATGVPVGLGSYVQWDRKLVGRLGQALLCIHAIKAVGIGIGPEVALRPGSRVHDEILPPAVTRDAPVRPTNNAGGLEGGVTNGEDLRVSA